jgi:hypothetical protein
MKRLAVALVPLAMALSACAVGIPTASTDVSDSGVTLNGTVHSDHAALVEYWWRYGPTTSYGTETPRHSITVGGGGVPHPVSEPISGLSANSTVHFQFCVQDTFDEPPRQICSSDRTFATVGDYVRGSAITRDVDNHFLILGFDARSGSLGENPAGTVGQWRLGAVTNWSVSCLLVTGSKATLGLDAPDPFEDAFAFIDMPTLGVGSYALEPAGSRPATECPAAPDPGTFVGTMSPLAGPDALTVHDQP